LVGNKNKSSLQFSNINITKKTKQDYLEHKPFKWYKGVREQIVQSWWSGKRSA